MIYGNRIVALLCHISRFMHVLLNLVKFNT